MYICIKCRVEMHCLKNGVGADYGFGHVYPGDMYVCGVCGFELLATNSGPTSDKEYITQDYYVHIKKGGVVPVNDSKRRAILDRLRLEFADHRN